jgi:hypothetical protein
VSELPVPPYPADTRAKGWRFELDIERVMQSDTWALAQPELRPWLLMLWVVAWQQVPCGSMPSDDALIAARLGMKPTAFKKVRDVLMRGWWAANDGRLYHGTVAERVLDMLGRKEGDRKRKADYRARMEAERKAAESSGVPGMSHGTDAGRTVESGGSDDTRTGTSTGFKTKNLSVPDGTDADASPPDGLTAEEAIFQVAVPWLVERGVPDRNARSLMGAARKQLGDDGACELAQQLIREKPTEPAAWISAAINARMKPGAKGSRPNRQEALEARNHEVARRWANGGSA